MGDGQNLNENLILAGSQNEAQESHWFTTVDDVDGGNPTPVDNVNVPLCSDGGFCFR